jgi:Fe-S cluster biogenesis protein NfuA
VSDGEALDIEALERRVARVSEAMATHGGGIELVGVDRRGGVRVRFTGLCSGCQLRPLTFVETIEPALQAIPGVDSVHADGARISEEALARIRYYHGNQSIDSIEFSV